ncbi:hypothetical protein MTO96_003612 [Rhipicephalus appendiculatus]
MERKDEGRAGAERGPASVRAVGLRGACRSPADGRQLRASSLPRHRRQQLVRAERSFISSRNVDDSLLVEPRLVIFATTHRVDG